MMRSALTALLLSGAAACQLVSQDLAPPTPQRRTFSVSTATPRAGQLDLELGLAHDLGDGIALPATLRWGADEQSELFLGGVPWSERDDTDGRGVGDVTLGARRRVREQHEDEPSLALQAAVKIPTADADEGLGSGELDLLLAGILSRDEGVKSSTLYYQLGLLGESGDQGIDLEHLLTAAFSQSIDERLGLFAEVAGVWSPEQERSGAYLVLGATWAPSAVAVVDVAAQFGFGDDAEDLVLVIGLSRALGRLIW
jgi:hypothetical protein